MTPGGRRHWEDCCEVGGLSHGPAPTRREQRTWTGAQSRVLASGHAAGAHRHRCQAGATVGSVDERRARPQHLPQRPPQQPMAWRGGAAVRHPATVPCRFVPTRHSALPLPSVRGSTKEERGISHLPRIGNPVRQLGPSSKLPRLLCPCGITIHDNSPPRPHAPPFGRSSPESLTPRRRQRGTLHLPTAEAPHSAITRWTWVWPLTTPQSFFPPLANYRVGYHDAGN